MRTFRSFAHNALRIAAGILFMQHGVQKLFGWLGGNAVELVSVRGLAGVLEVFGGFMVVIGLFTQPVAFILSGEMAIAYFWRHLPRDFWPIQNGGEPAALFAFIFIYLAAVGAGSFSIDAMMGRERHSGRSTAPEDDVATT